MSRIVLKNASLSFIFNQNGSSGIKDLFINILKLKKTVIFDRYDALKDINLELNDGDKIGIIGNNGSGKSTLMKVISGIYGVDSGIVNIEGTVTPIIELGTGFNPNLTGRENLHMTLALRGFSRSSIIDMEKGIVDFVDIGNFIDRQLHTYSSGMMARLAFAISTATHPDILILDEVFATGDAFFIEKAKNRMGQVIDKANIMIIVSHNESDIRGFCNRAIVIDNGRILYDGSVNGAYKYYHKMKS